jgi:hypothetical protein
MKQIVSKKLPSLKSVFLKIIKIKYGRIEKVKYAHETKSFISQLEVDTDDGFNWQALSQSQGESASFMFFLLILGRFLDSWIT